MDTSSRDARKGSGVNSGFTRSWPLDFQWPTADPFLFCVHHVDAYPRGNAEFGPDASLANRPLGNDFEGIDGWRMYHGQQVPGFPVHPHRGFETVTVVLDGVVDHADSMGAAGRYGAGDVQWMTAGRGVQHSEMFPLLHQDRSNRMELFQIWLNLPAASKMSVPHFAMFWKSAIPIVHHKDEQSRETSVTLIAGSHGSVHPPAPPPDSWAAVADHQVAIWLINMSASAEWTLPPVPAGVTRNLYLYSGDDLRVAGQPATSRTGMELVNSLEISLTAGASGARLLLLQGKPIAEPVASYGPFVMNSRTEIEQAFSDYRRTGFGGWPWPRADQVHDPDRGRFAKYADGHVDEPDH